jgi:hypothetical protein
MPTATDLIASLLAEAADALARNARAMPEDRLTWKPMDAGRTALDMIVECGAINGAMPRILESRHFPDIPSGWMDGFRAEHDTPEKALRLLKDGSDALVAAVRAFPATALDDSIRVPFRGGMDKTYAELMMIPYWNMTYHQGQICYVQTLYGDREMH